MGVVYRAEDTKLGRPVALKVLRPRFAGDEERLRRFVREARAAAALSHPSIATIHQIDESDGTTFIAMEFVEGDTLRHLVEKGGMDLADVVRIAHDIASGLAHAHERGVVHRDLKPDNVMVTRDGQVKILDFGLAKLLQVENAASDDDLTQMATIAQPVTQEGRVFGTTAYMSPEQARGKPLDARSDIFSFGVMLYELVTGRPPFAGETSSDTITAILRDAVTPALELNPTTPMELDRIIGRCLQKVPADRYQTSGDLASDLGLLRRSSESLTGLSAAMSVSGTAYTHSGYGSRPSGALSSTGIEPRPLMDRVLRGVGAAALVLVGIGVIGLLVDRARDTGRRSGVAVAAVTGNALTVHSFQNLANAEDPERFGQILQELIITDLSDVDSLKVYSSQRLYDVQKTLTGSTDRGFDKAVATEVAQYLGAANMVTGTLGRLDDKWVLACQLVDVATGTIRASKRIAGDDLFAMVDDLTDAIRSEFNMRVAPGGDVARKTSRSFDAHEAYLAGIDLLNEQKFDDAAASFRQAVEIDPDFTKAYYQLGIASWWNGDAAGEAHDALETITSGRLIATDKERRLAEGTIALVDRKFDEAIPRFQSLAESYPDDKQVWYVLGEALYHSTEPDKMGALSAFGKAVRLDPRFYLAYRHMFDVYRDMDMSNEAVSLARVLLSLDPTRPQHHEWLLTSVAALDDPAALEEALHDLETRYASDLKRADMLRIVGGAHVRSGDFVAADRVLAQLRDVPGVELLAADYGRMGLCRRELADFDAAEQWLHRAIEADSSRGEAWRDLGIVYMLEGRVADALSLADRMQRRAKRDEQDWYDLFLAPMFEAHFLPLAGRDAEAAGVLDRIQRISSEKSDEVLGAEAPRFQGMGQLFAGDLVAARASMENAVHSRDGERADDLWALARVQRLAFELDEADSNLAQAVAIDDEHNGARAEQVVLALDRGNVPKALALSEAYVSDRPKEMAPYFARLRALVIAGDVAALDTTLAMFRERVPIPESERALLVSPANVLRGGTLFSLLEVGELDRAEAMVRRAETLAGGPGADTHLARGWLALRRNDAEKARTAFRKGLAVAHPHSFVFARLSTGSALASLALGDVEAARAAVWSILDGGPVHVDTFRLLAYVLVEANDAEGARTWAERAMYKDPSHRTLSTLAWVLVRGNLDVSKGQALATQALDLPRRFDPLDSVGLHAPPEHTLGLAALRRGDIEAARRYFEEGIAQHPARQSLTRDLERAEEEASGSRG